MKLRLLLPVLVCALSASFAQTRYVDSVFSSVTTTSDIVYGTGLTATSTSQNLTLDVYQPAGDTVSARPLLIMAHEGSFLFGDKTDGYMTDYAKRMAKRGYVVACMTYRKGWVPNPNGTAEDNTRRIIPAAWRGIQDFKTAVRFFRKNAATGGNTYKINPNNIAGGGFGAGAYLPINAQIIDLSSEMALPSLNKKADNDPTNDPDSGPYLDTTQTNLGGIYDTQGGGSGYSWRVPLVLIYSGATIDTMLFNAGNNPKAISCHGDLDETTPYKTAIVNAQTAPGVLIPIVKVHGTYQINRILDKLGVNKYGSMKSDGFPQKMIADNKQGPLNMYKKGLYTFVGDTYMPWDCAQTDYSTTCEFYMDTVVRFSAPRIAYTFGYISTAVYNQQIVKDALRIYPNPAHHQLTIDLSKLGEAIDDIQVIDVTGKTVAYVKSINSFHYNLNTESFAPGLYFARIIADDQSVTKQFVVE